MEMKMKNRTKLMFAAELAQFLYDHTPGFLKEAFQQYNFRSDEILSNAGTGK